MSEFFQAAWRKEVRMRALKVAAVVGTMLVAINHGDALLANAMTQGNWLKVLLTFCVPYFVSWYSAVKANSSNT